MPHASFPQSVRLKCPAEFTHALKGKRIARGTLFTLIYQPKAFEQTQEAHARLGLIVAKRFAKLAPSRNALKRVCRESFRHVRTQLDPGDYVVRLHAPIDKTSLTELKRRGREDIDRLFSRALKVTQSSRP